MRLWTKQAGAPNGENGGGHGDWGLAGSEAEDQGPGSLRAEEARHARPASAHLASCAGPRSAETAPRAPEATAAGTGGGPTPATRAGR